MKKAIPLTIVLTFLLVTASVSAKSGSEGEQISGDGSQQRVQQQNQNQFQQQLSQPSTGNQIQNQNQVQTQNQGKDSQLNVNTQEQESLGKNQEQLQSIPKNESPQSETAQKHISNVTTKVEEMLTTKTIQNGTDEQVRQIFQEQKIAQQEIQTELGKVDARGRLLKLIIGSDFQALKNIQKQTEQNRLRIQQLTQLQNQLTNRGDIIQVQEIIQALIDQNTTLTNRTNLEEQSVSLFGWIFSLFAK